MYNLTMNRIINWGGNMKQFKFKKTAVILGAILTIAIIALITLGRGSVMTAVTSMGKQTKLSGEKIQSGLVVSLGDYIYFPNPSDNNKIYKVKADGTGKDKISNDSASYLVLADKWIYYANNSDGFKLYKIKVDGTGRAKITDDGVKYINVSVSGIYYSNIKDEGKLYHVGFNGKGNKKISDESASYINVVGNSIIYRNGALKIVKINSDGTGRTVIQEEKVSFAKADNDGKIYCGVQSDNRSIYSVNQNGGPSAKVFKTSTFYAEPLREWIYFTDNEKDNHNTYYSYIYRVKKDGTDLQRLSVEAVEEFCIHKDIIVYRQLGSNGNIYTMNLDGTQRKALNGKTVANSVTEICRELKDKIDFDITDNKMAEAYKKAKEVLAVIIKPGMSELEKELSIHDYLVKNVKYDHQVIDALNQNFVMNLDSHDAYNVLINGKGVCDGYAWTTKLMLGMCGIDSEVIIGTGKTKDETKKESRTIYHAWNTVKIDGQYYQLDVTWDENIYEQLNTNCYKYFNVSDDIMAKDHEWSEGYYTKCTSTKYNFFNNIVAATRDRSIVYYSNESDNYKLYRINIDGSEKKKINENKSLYMDVSEGWIYYSDYEDGGALYKMSTDGKNKTKLCSEWCINIEVKDGFVEYVNHDSKQKCKIKI